MVFICLLTMAMVLSCSNPGSGGNQTYFIGDTGPGGGLVFYDKGNTNGGWRYLEVGPTDLAAVPWSTGAASTTGANGYAVGTGKTNTQAIIAVQGAGTYAATVCTNYSSNGKTDWYLPTGGEFDAIALNLTSKGLGTVAGTYWTSWENSSTQAQYVNISSGGTNYPAALKGASMLVRPVRQF
jgi:hypothetical protein